MYGYKTIGDFNTLWPNIEVVNAEVMNKDIEKDSNEYIKPGQENYIYRCRDCVLRGFAMHNFGKWRPLYFSGSKYKSSTFKGHFDTCKGKANSSQQILPHIIKKIATKRQREEFETEIQRKECAKQGMLMSYEESLTPEPLRRYSRNMAFL